MNRELVPKEAMALPTSSTPRPGEAVVWYTASKRMAGIYMGHGIKARPIVKSILDVQSSLDSFESIRIKDPTKRIPANWEDLSEESLLRPTESEKHIFNDIMSAKIPPGPSYLELCEEIWFRGYEVYVVGGTVRDVICGQKPHDVDLVTTMPILKFDNLLRSMFKGQLSFSDPNGYARLGGSGKSGDPFIDLKTFTHSGMGTPNALFGSTFARDIGVRDFACNSVYYDPINKVLIDPSCRGIQDAAGRILSLVCDLTEKDRRQLGQIGIRFFKFIMRGFECDTASEAVLRTEIMPCIRTMQVSERIAYVRRQIFGKLPIGDHAAACGNLKEVACRTGYEELWAELFEPLTSSMVG